MHVNLISRLGLRNTTKMYAEVQVHKVEMKAGKKVIANLSALT